MITNIINIKDCPKGWRNSLEYEYIGRGSIFGNPFMLGRDGDRFTVIEKCQIWFDSIIKDRRFRREVAKLEGKILVCHCKPKPCHGDIYVKWLENKNTDQEK